MRKNIFHKPELSSFIDYITKISINNISINRNYIGLAFITLLSQGFGFLRELLFAYYQGASGLVEAFQVAETIPLLLTQIVVGSVPLAITPMIVRADVDNPGKGKVLFTTLTVITTVLLIFITICVNIFSSQILSAVAPGFRGNKHEIAVRLTIIMSPNILSISLLALFTAFLNANKNFLFPSALTLLFNIFTIMALILYRGSIYHVAAGATIGALSAFVICAISVNKKDSIWSARKELDYYFILPIGRALAPIIVFIMLTSLGLLIDKTIASFGTTGSVAYLSYSFKVINIPVHLFSMSFIRVMIPSIAHDFATANYWRVNKIIRRVSITSIAMSIPISILIYIFRLKIVEILFMRGQFTTADVSATASCIGAYSIGFMGMILNAFFLGIVCAIGNYHLPIRVLSLQLILCCSISVLLLPSYGAAGIAFGNAVANSIAALHWWTLLKKII